MMRSTYKATLVAAFVGCIGMAAIAAPASVAFATEQSVADIRLAQVDRRVDRRQGRQGTRQDIRVDRRDFYAARPYGHRVTVLPAARVRLHVRGATYYYHSGVYYSYRAGDYVVIRAPHGARIRVLPAGYRAFRIAARRYFYVNNTYYIYDSAKTEYVVVEVPDGAEDAMKNAPEDVEEELFVYPADGQTEADTDRDRYECHRWAVEQSDYDPSMVSTSSGSKNEYIRAETACLEGRGYTVN